MKLRAYLVDDEPLALERLRRLLEETGRVEVVGIATEPEDAVAALSAETPDVCFLDIEMPRLNGFEVLARLTRQPIVIFTTAYNQYALKAFAVNSVDYLLKPVESEDLDRALIKIERLRASGQFTPPDIHTMFRQLMDSMREPRSEFPERIASRLGDRLWFLDLDKVTHFCAEDKLTFAVSDGKKFFVDHTIAELEIKLNPRQFARIHRGTVVNLAWIKEVGLLPGGALSVRLKDDKETELTVARDRSREFKERAAY
jgi:two-component system LytT family response regulator